MEEAIEGHLLRAHALSAHTVKRDQSPSWRRTDPQNSERSAAQSLSYLELRVNLILTKLNFEVVTIDESSEWKGYINHRRHKRDR